MKVSQRDPRVYLHDILGAIERLEEYAKKGRRSFFTDFMVQDAIIRQLSIVGEATVKLPKALREKHREIIWKDIIGMRNIIVHDYSHLDLEQIWDSIEQDLPVLKQAVKAMLKTTADWQPARSRPLSASKKRKGR